jgi:hypothetical protein
MNYRGWIVEMHQHPQLYISKSLNFLVYFSSGASLQLHNLPLVAVVTTAMGERKVSYAHSDLHSKESLGTLEVTMLNPGSTGLTV